MPKKSLDERIATLYYTASEARTVLGMSKDSFNYWVKTGKIQKRSFLGKHGYYAKKDIDSIAAEIEAILLADAPDPLVFRRATPDDIEKEEYLAYQVFGQASATPELKAARRAYLQVSPDSFWHLYDQDRLTASINIFPLRHTAYEQFKNGKRGWTYSLSQLEQFRPGHPLECIIIDFLSTPVVPPARRKQYAARVLAEMGKVLTEWGRMGIEITHVAAASATQSGQRILQNAGFQVVGDSGHNRLIFELDIEHADTKMLAGYKQAITEWKNAHTQITQPEAIHTVSNAPESVKLTPATATSTHPPPAPRTPTRMPSGERIDPVEAHRPEGTIPLRDLAAQLGISEKTLIGHLGKPELEHMPIAIPNREGQFYRYFTPEQVQRVKTWHAATSKKKKSGGEQQTLF